VRRKKGSRSQRFLPLASTVIVVRGEIRTIFLLLTNLKVSVAAVARQTWECMERLKMATGPKGKRSNWKRSRKKQFENL
jgi:hypothetical protein